MCETHAEPASLNVSKYCDLLARLEKEFCDRFGDSEKVKPCVTFVANPFMCVDITDLSAQMADLFCVDPTETEIEIINMQNNLHLKSQQQSSHFLSLVEPDSYKNLNEVALKNLLCLGLLTCASQPSLT